MHFKIIVSLSFILSLASCKTATSQLNNPRNIIYNWKTDTAKKTVPLSEFTVVLPKGAFSVLTFPKFVTALEGLRMYSKHEPVISVSLRRADYLLFIKGRTFRNY